MNVFARFVGVVISPRSTFENVVANPRVLGILVLVCLMSAVILGWFFSTPVGRDAWLEAATSRNPEITDQQYEAMARMASFAGYLAIGQAVVGVPLMILILSGILYAVFNAAMGGTATFKQVFAVVAHAWVIPAVSQLFTIPLSYARGSLSSATSLGVLLPMIDETSFAGKFLGSIDFFMIWGLIVLAMGLAVLYRRRTQPIATSLFVCYGVIALAIAFFTSS